MDIIYVSCLTEKKKFFSLFKDYDNMPGQQGQKYHRLIVEGITQNGGKVHTVTSLPVTPKNCDIKFIRASKSYADSVEYNYLPIVNLPGIKNVIVMLSAFFKTLSLIRKHKGCNVVCDILNISVSSGALFAAKLKGVPAVGIVTDVPNYMSKNPKSFRVKINNKLMNSFDKYVFLTEEMKNVVNCNGKKWIVVEGQVDINMDSVENRLDGKYEKKICIYAGRIQKIYGIKYLTEAFIKANHENAELHIYGTGDYEEELKEICKRHDNVKYFGTKPNDYIVEEQLKAALLINPRPTDQEFTKYSFPSKNMEYMVSGTATLTTLLPGMPKEYLPYVFLIKEETVDGLAETLKDVLSKTTDELHDFGKKAREWVLKEKNNRVQTKKILDMLTQ